MQQSPEWPVLIHRATWFPNKIACGYRVPGREEFINHPYSSLPVSQQGNQLQKQGDRLLYWGHNCVLPKDTEQGKRDHPSVL